MTISILLYIAVGFAAQIVDGTLGMAYGVTCNSFLLGLGVPAALASASVHAAETVTTFASGLAHLREAVDRVAFRDDFPEDAERPVILRWDPTARPVSILVLQGDDPIAALTEFAREVVKPALEQVDGISRAEVVGGADREILVEPDARRMAIYGIDMQDIRAALSRSNISIPGGKVRRGPARG